MQIFVKFRDQTHQLECLAGDTVSDIKGKVLKLVGVKDTDELRFSIDGNELEDHLSLCLFMDPPFEILAETR